jgi:hypothetical protein
VDLPDVWVLDAGKTGRLHHGIGVGVTNVQLAGLVVAVSLDDAHVILILGSYLLVLLGARNESDLNIAKIVRYAN